MKMTLFLNHRCNLRCTYCYTGEKFDRAMSLETAAKAICFGLDQTTTGYLLIAFFGGEPLLELDRMEAIVALAEERARERKKRLHWFITTNGTLIDDRSIALFRSRRFQVQLSIDGNQAAHDATRPRVNGNGSHAEVSRNLARLLREGFHPRVNAVVDPRNLQQMADSLSYFVELGCEEILFSPNLAADWSDEHRVRYERALRDLADRYIGLLRAGRNVRVDPLNSKIATHVKGGYSASTRCAFGCEELAISPRGRIYPCDRLVGQDDNPALRIGHLDSGIDTARRDAMIRGKNTPDPECEDCWLKNRCMRWCGCANFETTGDVTQVSPTTCWMEQRLIAEADRAAEILFAEKCPAFINRFYPPKLRDAAVARAPDAD
jgi:uncharacterized protein